MSKLTHGVHEAVVDGVLSVVIAMPMWDEGKAYEKKVTRKSDGKEFTFMELCDGYYNKRIALGTEGKDYILNCQIQEPREYNNNVKVIKHENELSM